MLEDKLKGFIISGHSKLYIKYNLVQWVVYTRFGGREMARFDTLEAALDYVIKETE